MMVKGSDIWLWVEGKEGISKTGGLTQATVSKKLQLGAPTGGVTADVRFDYLYQRYLWTIDSPVDLATGFGFSTTQQTCVLPTYAPAKSVAAWQKAIIDTSHGESALEIIDTWVFSEDFDSKGDNTDLLVTEPENWVEGGQSAEPFSGDGMNIDFNGPVGLVHSATQYVRYVGHGGQLKDDHYVQYTLGPTRVSDGSFISDATPRYNPYIILKDDSNGLGSTSYYLLEWSQSVIGNVHWFIYRVQRDPANSTILLTLQMTNDGSRNPLDGRKMRGEIRGNVITLLCDFQDGNGWTQMLQIEDTETDTAILPPSDGDPGFWFGPLRSSSNQSTMKDMEIGNFEGESNTVIGTTRVRVEYSNDRGATWDLSKVRTLNSIPKEEVDLSDVPAVGSGLDALRFSVEQVSPGSLAEPMRVEQITVKATYDVSGVELYPEWGPKIGGTSVAATLHPDAKQNCGSIPQLSTLTGYGSSGSETSLTGDYNTVKDFPGFGKAYGDPSLVGGPSLELTTVAVQGDGVYSSLPAQGVHANSGEGLVYSNVSDSGRNLLSGHLLVQEGAVRVELDSDVHVFYQGTYVDLRA